MKIAIVDEIHEDLYSTFQSKGWECVSIDKSVTKESFTQEIHLYDGIIIRSQFKLDKEILSKAKNLKFIGRPGAGLDLIDVEYCEENNIQCFRSPEGNRDAVAEHAIGMLLCLMNKIHFGNDEVKKGVWDRKSNTGFELIGKTVGIIGFGYMGEAFSKRLNGFGVNVIAYDKYKTNFGNDDVKEVSLNDVFEQSDIVSLHTPLTEETKEMVNEEFINSFQKPFYFINTSRGKSNHIESINQGLEFGKILGACLDVLPEENKKYEESFELNQDIQRLISFKNTLLTPHVAGITHQSFQKMCGFLADKIVNVF